ncbi:argininosuccinate synthase [Bartonella henselae]|uniref:Argininosuccinate synthase n=1 Tax=Bartonella henselae TaxID=38323 RepID=X5M5E1_BARHN|nr:argininosuccinate synthase [Bartonella henselae]
MLQAALDLYKENVTDKITLKLYKGNVMAEGCQSK